jgi:competence ComEA-like helix-hairpin-helix protein
MNTEETRPFVIARRLIAIGAIALLVAIVVGESLQSRRADAGPDRPPAHSAPKPAADGRPAEAMPAPAKVNLNTASEAQLLDLPGVGPKKAALIIDWRAKHGPFQRPQDLRRVKGFGRKTFEKLAPYLTVSDKPAAAK